MIGSADCDTSGAAPIAAPAPARKLRLVSNRPLLHGHMRAFGFVLGKVCDAVVNQTAQPLQELDARVAEVVAGGFAPHALHNRNRGGAEEAAGSMGVGPRLLFAGAGILRPSRSPSSPRSVSYSPTLRATGKAPPSK